MHRVLPFLIAIGACDSSLETQLLYSRQSGDPSSHVFPSAEYGGDWALDRFTETQLGTLPFLRQLSRTPAYAPTTALRVPFTPSFDAPQHWVDTASARDSIAVYRFDENGPSKVPLGLIELEHHVNALVIWPEIPWSPGRHAVLVRAQGLRTRGGSPILSSADQAKVINEGDPATDLEFATIDLADDAISSRADTLAFWVFDVADPSTDLTLLKAVVEGDAEVDRGGQDDILDITPFMPPETRELAVGGARVIAEGDEAIGLVYAAAGAASLPHDAIARIVGGVISTPVFISDPLADPNAIFLAGTFLGRNPAAPFSAENPLSLAASTPTRPLPYLMAVPKSHAPKMPVIVAIHGLSRSKEDWLAFANTACATGHAIIGIDLYQHGDRQTGIIPAEGGFASKIDAVLSAQGLAFPDPFFNPTFLGRTRDKLRQSLVDLLALTRLLRAGDGDNPLIDFDGDGSPDDHGPLRVVGHSLGSMLGTALVSVSPEFDRAILNAGGSHLAHILADSPFLHRDIDLLLYATANTPSIGLLAGSTTKLVPDSHARGLLNIVADTLLGAVDSGSFIAKLASTRQAGSPLRVLVQLPSSDQLIPRAAQRRLALAFVRGSAAETPVTLLGDDIFDLGLPTSNSLSALNLALIEGRHGVLLDFENPTATASAQAQAATFLATP